MLETELARTRARIEKLGREAGRLHLQPPAPPEQIREFESSLGVELPLEFREFLLQISSGVAVGHPNSKAGRDELQLGPFIFHNDGFRFSYGRGEGCWSLVAFPLQHLPYDECHHFLRSWDDLTGHEKIAGAVALQLGVWGPYRLATLVLSGPERGKVWHGATYSGQSTPSHLSFLPAFHRMLDEC